MSFVAFATTSSPAFVMQAFTTRRSFVSRAFSTRPRASSRSRRRVRSGSWFTIRSAILPLGSPADPAPLRMRRTLNCGPDSSDGLSASVIQRDVTWDVRRIST